MKQLGKRKIIHVYVSVFETCVKTKMYPHAAAKISYKSRTVIIRSEFNSITNLSFACPHLAYCGCPREKPWSEGRNVTRLLCQTHSGVPAWDGTP